MIRTKEILFASRLTRTACFTNVGPAPTKWRRPFVPPQHTPPFNARTPAGTVESSTGTAFRRTFSAMLNDYYVLHTFFRISAGLPHFYSNWRSNFTAKATTKQTSRRKKKLCRTKNKMFTFEPVTQTKENTCFRSVSKNGFTGCSSPFSLRVLITRFYQTPGQ